MTSHDAGAHRRRILVVEDDRAIADAIRRRLESAGYAVDAVHDGPAAVTAADRAADAHAPYEAVVLDVMLPGFDGHEVCRRIQARDPLPVLMLTARAEEGDRLAGLAVGADDYLTKPFSPRELVARVAALLRRVDRASALAAAAAAPSVLTSGTLAIDVRSRRVSVAGEHVHLTRTEFDLLCALARRPGDAVERERLLAEVWDWSPTEASRAAATSAARSIDSHVKSLRRKVGAARIRTVHGVGYALEDPADPQDAAATQDPAAGNPS